jgi:hypothetical protein|tara:strand:+ start:11462 stop:11821 length:360 start_codon:yes stop_codon:yes gene_type:complete
MAPTHPDRAFWKDEAEAIGNLTTADPKQDAIQNERAVSSEEPGLKVAAPFEEKTDEEKKLVRKIDMYLMPTIWVLYCFSYMVSSIRIRMTLIDQRRLGSYSNRKCKGSRHGHRPWPQVE